MLSKNLLVPILAAAVLPQRVPTDGAARALDSFRQNCVTMRDQFIDGPQVARTCRVNELARIGVVDGRDVYCVLYRRIVTVEGQLVSQSTLDLWDKPPYRNTSAAILEAPMGGVELRLSARSSMAMADWAGSGLSPRDCWPRRAAACSWSRPPCPAPAPCATTSISCDGAADWRSSPRTGRKVSSQ
jgi:hypothetical protein